MNKNFIFVSGNAKKVELLERFLGQKVQHENLDLDEVQSLDPEKVVRHKAKEAFRVLKKPILVDDVSLKFTALGNLPGTFVKFFLSELGTEGLCRLLDNFEDKSATARVTYGLYDGVQLYLFVADVQGTISSKSKGNSGLGWDSVFIPSGQTKTYAEMDEVELEKYSVRKKAVIKLKAFIDEN